MQAVLAVRVQTEDRDDGRVIKLGIELGLGNEFGDAFRTGQVFLFQGLDDHIAAKHEVFRQKDPSESALGDHLFDPIALPAFLQRATESRGRIGIQVDGLNRFLCAFDDNVAPQGAGFAVGLRARRVAHHQSMFDVALFRHVFFPSVAVHCGEDLFRFVLKYTCFGRNQAANAE